MKKEKYLQKKYSNINKVKLFQLKRIGNENFVGKKNENDEIAEIINVLLTKHILFNYLVRVLFFSNILT